MARILCVNPWIVDFVAYNQWIEPLGLLTVAGVLRAAGHEVELLDCLDRHHPDAPAPRFGADAFGCGHFSKEELPKPAPLAHVRRHYGRYGLAVAVVENELSRLARPDAVLVTSMMTYWYPGAFEAIRLVKTLWPDVPVALGGVYAKLCTDHAWAHSGADAAEGAGTRRVSCARMGEPRHGRRQAPRRCCVPKVLAGARPAPPAGLCGSADCPRLPLPLPLLRRTAHRSWRVRTASARTRG